MFTTWPSQTLEKKVENNILRGKLAQCGMEISDLGSTYLADRLGENDNIIESAIDHNYYSSNLTHNINTKKLEDSSTDHLPILASIDQNHRNNKLPTL